MSKSKGRVRNERGLVDMTVAPEETPPLVMPSPDDCDEHEYDIYEAADSVHIHVRFVTHLGQPVEFAFTQRVRDGIRWADVIRIDTCHDEVHVHRFGQSGTEFARTTLWPIEAQADVARGMDEAERLVVDEWEENVRRWRRGQ